MSTVNTWCKAEKVAKLLRVYLTATGRIAMEQRQVAALLYAGPQSVITGPVAMRLHRLRCPGGDAIDVLIPWTARRQSIRFRAGSPHTPNAGVQSDWSDPIRQPGPRGGRRRTWLHQARRGPRSGRRGCAEDRFARSRQIGLELTGFGDRIREYHFCAADGTDIGEADAWWADAGVSAEIDSREYHFYRDGWLKTDAKHSRMLKYGILPIHRPGSTTTGPRSIATRLRIVAFEALG